MRCKTSQFVIIEVRRQCRNDPLLWPTSADPVSKLPEPAFILHLYSNRPATSSQVAERLSQASFQLSHPVGSFPFLRCCVSTPLLPISGWSPILVASKLWVFSWVWYHFKEMDFAHLERSISKMERGIYVNALLRWGTFRFLPQNICVIDFRKKSIDSSFSLQDMKTTSTIRKE
jgi:hypothetical protein